MVAKIDKRKYDSHAIWSFSLALFSTIFWFILKNKFIKINFLSPNGQFYFFFILSSIIIFLAVLATIEIKHSDKLRGDSLAWIAITASIMILLSKIFIAI